VGCELCDHQGYAGRLALLEVLAIDDDIESCFLAEASPAELLEAATGNGFEPIASDAIDKVRQGLTSFEEASRVVNLSTVKSGVPVE
jgi:type II secretory ATPase GspE/PulE/Tfp pilus assembly ATPase PilB-like protein